MTDTPNLWPDLGHIDTSQNPRTFVKEQGTLLGSMTSNRLLADVKVKPHADGNGLYTEFHILVPAAKNYSYELFYYSTKGVKFFPMTLHFNGTAHEVYNFDGFKAKVAEILKSHETKEVLRGLLALADEP